tara:strand:- start:71 stop:250 length:180 start_codon:yes stop_codon:yes gene_type:complete
MLTKQQIYTALDNMDRFGGSFIASLATCYRKADPENKDILTFVFAKYFIKYANFTKEKN